MGVSRVDSDFIPLSAFVIATIRSGFGRVRLESALQLFREQVVLIPVLLNPWVRQAREDNGARRRIVSGQNWFPHRKDTDARILSPLENSFDCGCPPQTCWSRWRKQQNDAHLARVCVELCAQVVEVR